MTWLKKIFKNNKGFSLVELVISIAIMSIITAGIGAAMVSATRNYGRGTTEVDLQTNAQNITNIITNLIVDSANAANADDGSSVDTGSTSLYVTSISGRCYVISYIGNVNSNGTGNLYYAEADSFTDCTDYSILSENVVGFTADTHTYPNDYTVHITIELSYPSENRSYASSFSVTSRNAAGAGSYINNLDAASIICDPMVIIEPNESYVNKSSLSLNCYVITAGSVTDTTYSYYVLQNKDDDIANALDYADCGLQVTCDAGSGKLSFTANQYITPNSSGCLYVKVVTNATNAEGNNYDTKYITVKVRKVASVNITKDKDASSNSSNQAGSIHVITGNLSIYNASRQYVLDSDSDYDETTSSVNDVIWTVSCKGKNGNNVAYYLDSVKLENGTDILSQILSTDGYKGTSGEKFTVKLKNNLPKGEVITFTMTPVHNQGLCSYAGTTYVTNKASLAAYNGGTATAKTYPCNPAYYKISAGFFDEISDYQRGYTLNQIGFSNTTGSAVFNELFADIYVKYSAWYASDPDGIDSNENSYKDVLDWLDNFRNSDNFNIGYFYRLKSYTLDSAGNQISDEGWSQYRTMTQGQGRNSNFNFTTASNPSLSSAYLLKNGKMGGELTGGMTNRLRGDEYQSVEFVVVIYDNNGQILWPYYETLMDYGFGDPSKHCGQNFHFTNISKSITEDYSTYATLFTVVPATISYYANEQAGTSAGNSVGSTSQPLILGDNTVYSFSYDHIDWVGIHDNEYFNNLAFYVMKNSGSGWEIVGKAGMGEDLNKQQDFADGGFRINVTNLLYEVGSQNVSAPTDLTSTYRIIPFVYNFKLGYILDEDGIFSQTVYWDTDHVYSFLMTSGDHSISRIYDDELPSSITFRRYGSPKTISLILNDSTDYRATCNPSSVTYIEKKGFTSSLPTPSRSGYLFNGWFSAPTGGEQITDSTTVLTSDKIYAQWEDIRGKKAYLKISQTNNWGNVTNYNFTLTNFTDQAITVNVYFIVSSDALVTGKYNASYSELTQKGYTISDTVTLQPNGSTNYIINLQGGSFTKYYVTVPDED